MTDQNPWNLLAPSTAHEISEPREWYEADNVVLAEPVILKYLTSQIPSPQGKRILDFGCGSGQFTHRLQSLGYDAEGIDPASNMIKSAVARYGSKIKFSIGELEALPGLPVYDVIASVMVLQFVPNYQKVIQQLTSALKPGGLLALVVFNPAFISDWIKAGDPSYVDFDSTDHPTRGALLFGDVAVPTYIRTAAQYNEVAVASGLFLSHEEYPPFTQAFLQKYHVDGPTQNAEHMVLIYKKS